MRGTKSTFNGAFISRGLVQQQQPCFGKQPPLHVTDIIRSQFPTLIRLFGAFTLLARSKAIAAQDAISARCVRTQHKQPDCARNETECGTKKRGRKQLPTGPPLPSSDANRITRRPQACVLFCGGTRDKVDFEKSFPKGVSRRASEVTAHSPLGFLLLAEHFASKSQVALCCVTRDTRSTRDRKDTAK
jgi:hypothetical protein